MQPFFFFPDNKIWLSHSIRIYINRDHKKYFFLTSRSKNISNNQPNLTPKGGGKRRTNKQKLFFLLTNKTRDGTLCTPANSQKTQIISTFTITGSKTEIIPASIRLKYNEQW